MWYANRIMNLKNSTIHLPIMTLWFPDNGITIRIPDQLKKKINPH